MSPKKQNDRAGSRTRFSSEVLSLWQGDKHTKKVLGRHGHGLCRPAALHGARPSAARKRELIATCCAPVAVAYKFPAPTTSSKMQDTLASSALSAWPVLS